MRSVAIELTARCNQKCTYCYNSWRDDGGQAMGELEPDVLSGLVDRTLAENDLAYVTLTGGEPFLRKDIHDVIEQINRRGLGVSIISNGGMIRPENIERMKRQRVLNIQITLAGHDAQTHDAVAGSGSYDRIVGVVERLVEAGIPTSGSYLCTRASAPHAAATLARFADLGVRRISFNRFNPSGFSRAAMDALMPTRSDIVMALRQADDVARERDLVVTCTMPIPPCVVDYAEYPRVKFGHCSAADPYGEPSIGPDGSVKLCTLQRTSLGSLFDTSLAALLDTPAAHAFRAEIPAFCAGCPYQSRCLGGCGAAAEWVLGDRAELDPFVAQHVMPDFRERALARVDQPIAAVPQPGPVDLQSSVARLRFDVGAAI